MFLHLLPARLIGQFPVLESVPSFLIGGVAKWSTPSAREHPSLLISGIAKWSMVCATEHPI